MAAHPLLSSGTSGAVIVAVIVAALLHAVWNALAHGIGDRLIGFALIGVASSVCGAVAVAVTGPPAPGAWPYIAASVVLHIAYNVLLLVSYELGEFSQVYPLARGTSPWVVALVAATVLGQALPPLELVGVLTVSAGLISLIGRGSARAPLPALAAALGTGVMIAAYTVVDGVGVHQGPVLAYTGWLFLLQGPSMPLIAAVRYGRELPVRLRPSAITGLTGGVVSVAAYGLVLWAQTRGALAPIAALRETSIIMGAIIGTVFFGERFGPIRAVASAVVVTGIILINLA
jgi:drug/metabolite transporter (DMT)-like permease